MFVPCRSCSCFSIDGSRVRRASCGLFRERCESSRSSLCLASWPHVECPEARQGDEPPRTCRSMNAVRERALVSLAYSRRLLAVALAMFLSPSFGRTSAYRVLAGGSPSLAGTFVPSVSRRFPWLTFGWLCGSACSPGDRDRPSGGQSMADRYTYARWSPAISSRGEGGDRRRWRAGRSSLGPLASRIGACIAATPRAGRLLEEDSVLFHHVLDVTRATTWPTSGWQPTRGRRAARGGARAIRGDGALGADMPERTQQLRRALSSRRRASFGALRLQRRAVVRGTAFPQGPQRAPRRAPASGAALRRLKYGPDVGLAFARPPSNSTIVTPYAAERTPP